MAVRLLLGGALDTVASTSTSLSPSPSPSSPVPRPGLRPVLDQLSKSGMVLHNGSLRVYDVPQCGAAYTLAQLQNVFAAHAVEWNLMGRDRPWWSVLSVAEYDQGTAPSENTIRTFYESGRKHVDRVLADLHLAPPLHDMRVLDVGCGLGRLAHAFARLGAAVACVDQSWNHLRLAQKQAYKRLAAADARRIEHLVTSPDLIASVGGRRYDVVHSWIALQHAVAPLQAVFMQQMCDVLKSGGKGLLQIPFFTPMHYTPMDEIRHAFESRGCRVSQWFAFAYLLHGPKKSYHMSHVSVPPNSNTV
ncbi:hypothetical protein EMIHUDRAFT_234742 [Emiliania huxleyi CCMP1516]|uniref:Methyltransferase domain-containing protein n=2 Tax=Emiliania huxleyi TaxID=2903 RepID=A0A0D3JZ04_EMIH1|nr:hypothetical protein EMIHUDRAFT_234742 [Emiliania huxleyi CCMP1516]EOD28739.1 hypothetical protein EMIHUDRAFT_234742 [Emiliania huxleyi CCMP1516]|eukprot:XP_005781168.1 hypothetical protein EMIHUDRAFT_234742 [Emiliania huxleyi CCMP1516]